MRLNLGCNQHPQEGYINVDIEPFEGVDVVCNLEEKWPWEDNSVEYILAEDIVEHLHEPIHTMNEVYRVLKPGGTAFIQVPSTDGKGAFQDPTHVSFWNEHSFFYYAAHLDKDGIWRRGPMSMLYPSIKAAFQVELAFADGVIEEYNITVPYVQARLTKVILGAKGGEHDVAQVPG